MPPLNQPPDSKFAYVIVAARRARQLMSGAQPLMVNPRSLKPTRVAIEELNKSLLECQLPEISDGTGDEEGKRRKG